MLRESEYHDSPRAWYHYFTIVLELTEVVVEVELDDLISVETVVLETVLSASNFFISLKMKDMPPSLVSQLLQVLG